MAPKSVRDVHPETFIKAYAAHLKANDKIQLPAWVDVVKTGAHKELAPNEADWYYIRAAAIARKVYLRKDLGVGTLRREFGGRNKRRGTVPEHFAKAAGGVIRHVLQQLEELQLVEKSSTLKGGRIGPSALPGSRRASWRNRLELKARASAAFKGGFRDRLACRRITSQGQRDLDLIAGRIETEEVTEDFDAEE